VTHHRPSRALVTGGAGFIGSHLVEALVARGDQVSVLDDGRNSKVSDNLGSLADKITLLQGDCTRAADALAHAEPDVVFHLASPAYVPPSVDDPLSDLRGNVEQTLHLIQALRQHSRPPRLVHVSSAAIYGHPPVQPIRETYPPSPVSPYGVDKFCAEEHVRVASLLHDLRAVILRYFPVYGPRQRKQVVYDLICKLDKDPNRLEIHGTGRELRDLTFVDDIVRGTILAADRAPGRGEAYNLGSGRMVTIEHLARTICEVLGVTPELAFSGSVRPGDAERIVADITALRTLGYEPKIGLRDGIARTVAWHRASKSGHASVNSDDHRTVA
jgi:UDP-glucose 4-epimerase